jgi:AGZA family xanthine/uracil permease-like MFS transporter
VIGELWAALSGGHLVAYLSVVIPIGLLGVLASLQNIESAAAAGDRFPATPSLVVSGLGTLAAAAFGSPFPTSIYIGHPAWKKLGARAGYSALNGVFITLVCVTGTMATLTWLIPAEAGIAIIFWIGIIIAAQAFEVTDKKYYPAVVVGLLPALAAWVMLVVKTSIAAGGATLAAPLVASAHAAGAYLGGGFALEQGFLYSAMIWSAIVVCIIDRAWRRAAAWSVVGALLAATGLMHSYALTGRDTVIDLPLLSWLSGQWTPGRALFPAGGAALGYALATVVFLLAKFVTVPRAEDEVA